jgi:hypothetical protein
VSDIRFTPSQDGDQTLSSKKLNVSTTADGYKISGKDATTNSDGSIHWELSETIRLPVYDRYASSLTFEFGSSPVPFVDGTEAVAVLWFQDLVDDEEEEVRIPVVKSKDLKTLRQNVCLRWLDASRGSSFSDAQ